MRLVTLTLIFALWLAPVASATPYRSEIVKTAESYSYVREMTNRNDHPKINYWLSYLGLDNAAQIRRTGTGYSWCMAFVQGMYREAYANHNKKNPLPRSARCSEVWKLAKKDKYRYKTFTAKQVETGAVKLQSADVGIWSHSKVNEDFEGHTEIVRAPNQTPDFDTVGGNVGASNDINQQREQTGISKAQEKNGGVRFKERTVKKGSPKFRAEGFIRTLDK